MALSFEHGAIQWLAADAVSSFRRRLSETLRGHQIAQDTRSKIAASLRRYNVLRRVVVER